MMPPKAKKKETEKANPSIPKMRVLVGLGVDS